VKKNEDWDRWPVVLPGTESHKFNEKFTDEGLEIALAKIAQELKDAGLPRYVRTRELARELERRRIMAEYVEEDES
jgi:hypothetical protein